MDAEEALTKELDLREARLSDLRTEAQKLEREVAALKTSLDILQRGQMPGRRTETAAKVPSTTTGALVGAAMLSVAEAVALSPRWQREAEKVLQDGKPHELRELVDRAHQNAGGGAEVDRIRKTLHVWLSRKVEKQEARRVDRGWYQLSVAG